MRLLAKRMPRQGQERKEGEEKESGHLWVEGYYRLTGLFMLFGCYSLPFLRFFFFFLLLVCFRFLICKVKSFFFFPRRIKKAKNTGKEEERKVTHSFPDSFTKHRAERKGERRSSDVGLENIYWLCASGVLT